MENLVEINNALKSENISLKEVIERLFAEKTALSQTAKELLDANINLKAVSLILEKNVERFKNELNLKDIEINKLNQSKETNKEELPAAIPCS